MHFPFRIPFWQLLTLIIATLTVVCSASSSILLNRNGNSIFNDWYVRNCRYNAFKCLSEFNQTLTAIEYRRLWATQMIDSWGKLPSGLYEQNAFSFGNFDQCMAVKNTKMNTQYCLVEFKSPELLAVGSCKEQVNRPSQHIYYVGVCVPDSCGPKPLGKLIHNVMKDEILDYELSVGRDMCTRPVRKRLEAIDYITIAILTVVALVLLASTLYDVLTRNREESRRQAYIIAFSLFTNGAILFRRTEHRSGHLECLYGIRVLSIVWVVLTHANMALVLSPLINKAEIARWVENPWSMIFLSASFAVDSFLMISGLLVSYLLLNTLDKSNGKLNLIWFYIHRFIRLTPPLAALVLVCSSLIQHFGDGPLWKVHLQSTDEACKQYWWSTLLYLQNYVNPGLMCVSHSWYLAVDMQLYALAPLLIYPLWRWKLKCLPVVPILIVASMSTTFALFIVYQFSIRTKQTLVLAVPRMMLTYYPTHTRMGPWLVGVILGFIMHRHRGKTIYISKTGIVVGWTLTILTFLVAVFGSWPLQATSFKESVIGSAFYESISRVAWAGALAWLVFACTNGIGGPINWFLTLSVWQPFSRISYAIYLVHLPVQLVLAAQVRTGTFFSDTQAILTFWGYFGITLCISVIWTLAFELPVAALEKRLRNTNHGDGRKQAPTVALEENIVQDVSLTAAPFSPNTESEQIPSVQSNQITVGPVQYKQDQSEFVKRGLDIKIESTNC